MTPHVVATIECLFRQLGPQEALLEAVEFLRWQPGYAGWWLALEPDEPDERAFSTRIGWWLDDGRSYCVATPLRVTPLFRYA